MPCVGLRGHVLIRRRSGKERRGEVLVGMVTAARDEFRAGAIPFFSAREGLETQLSSAREGLEKEHSAPGRGWVGLAFRSSPRSFCGATVVLRAFLVALSVTAT